MTHHHTLDARKFPNRRLHMLEKHKEENRLHFYTVDRDRANVKHYGGPIQNIPERLIMPGLDKRQERVLGPSQRLQNLHVFDIICPYQRQNIDTRIMKALFPRTCGYSLSSTNSTAAAT